MVSCVFSLECPFFTHKLVMALSSESINVQQTSQYSRAGSTIPNNKAMKGTICPPTKQQSRKSGTGGPKLFRRASYSKHTFVHIQSWANKLHKEIVQLGINHPWCSHQEGKKLLKLRTGKFPLTFYKPRAQSHILCSSEAACQQMATNKN